MDVEALKEQIFQDAVTHTDAVDEELCEQLEAMQDAAVQTMDMLRIKGITRAEAIGIVQHTSVLAMLSQ